MRDVTPKPHFCIEATQGLLEVTQPALHLYYQESAASHVGSQNVAASSLAVAVKAHLNANDPAPIAQHFSDRRLYPCVYRIDQPVQLLATPPHLDRQTAIERANDALDHLDALP